jgi:hypothetical protein
LNALISHICGLLGREAGGPKTDRTELASDIKELLEELKAVPAPEQLAEVEALRAELEVARNGASTEAD